MKFKPMTDRRLWICAAAVGVLLALFVVVGMPLLQTGELPAFSRGGVLAGAAAFIGCAAVATALVAAAYCGAERLAAGRPAETEGRFSRVLGNGFAVFALLLICWLPVWLAFYPGVFSYDAATSFTSISMRICTRTTRCCTRCCWGRVWAMASTPARQA